MFSKTVQTMKNGEAKGIVSLQRVKIPIKQALIVRVMLNYTQSITTVVMACKENLTSRFKHLEIMLLYYIKRGPPGPRH